MMSSCGCDAEDQQQQAEEDEEDTPDIRWRLHPQNVLDKECLTPTQLKRPLEERLQFQSSRSPRAFCALDPLEHAWMLAAVDSGHDTMETYLCQDPALLTRRDFVSGFTALHWLAKRGASDSLVRLLRRPGPAVDVNVRGSGGLTPLHVAAMHSQYMVLKILVGAFGADVEAMDYSGRRAWQYLQGQTSLEMMELLGAPEEPCTPVGPLNTNNSNSCNSSKTTTELGRDGNQVESPARAGTWWRLGSFRRILAPFFPVRSTAMQDSM